MTFINESKDRIEIKVQSSFGFLSDNQYYVSDVLITPYKKRKPISISAQLRDSYSYRHRDYTQRDEYVRQEFLKYCTEKQIMEAVQEEYRKMAPTPENIVFSI